MNRQMKHKGYVLLLVLLGVAIVVVLYTADLKRIFGWGEAPKDDSMVEADRIAGSEDEIALPAGTKPSLAKFRDFRASVEREGHSVGQAHVLIGLNGVVLGSWDGEYTNEDKTVLTYQTSFAGNVDAQKTFTDTEGQEDPSLLYFVAEGKFIKQAYNTRSTRGGVAAGKSFIAGWLHPDGRAHGEIVLSYDSDEFEKWTWKK